MCPDPPDADRRTSRNHKKERARRTVGGRVNNAWASAAAEALRLD